MYRPWEARDFSLGARAEGGSVRRPLLLLAIATSAFLALVAYLAMSAGVPLVSLTKDPVAVAELPVYTGLLSQLGLLGWCLASGASLFTWALLRGRGLSRSEGAFLIASSALTAWVLLDDMLLIHEVVAPHVLGISQKWVYAGYGLLAAAYLAVFQRQLRAADTTPLAVALGCFAISIGADMISDRLHLALAGAAYVEDGFKLMGIACWCLFFVGLAYRRLRRP